MTAQISDTYTYNGELYHIVATTEPIRFSPHDYGFNPTAPHTACWDGYYCEYAVENGVLLFQTLNVYCEDGNYPDLFGVTGVPRKENKFDDFFTYRNMKHQMDYTGSIVIGNGFLNQYYIHMGYQRVWAYEEVLELKFEHGILVETVDHSQFVEELRKKVDACPEKFVTRPTMLSILKSFSLDARDKAWWVYA